MTDVLNKNKDEILKLDSKLKDAHSSESKDCIASNWDKLLSEMFNSLLNPTFIQHLKSSANCDHLPDNKVKVQEVEECLKITTVLHF